MGKQAYKVQPSCFPSLSKKRSAVEERRGGIFIKDAQYEYRKDNAEITRICSLSASSCSKWDRAPSRIPYYTVDTLQHLQLLVGSSTEIV